MSITLPDLVSVEGRLTIDHYSAGQMLIKITQNDTRRGLVDTMHVLSAESADELLRWLLTRAHTYTPPST